MDVKDIYCSLCGEPFGEYFPKARGHLCVNGHLLSDLDLANLEVAQPLHPEPAEGVGE